MAGKAKINADIRKSRNQTREMVMRQKRFNEYRRQYEKQCHIIHEISYDIALHKRLCIQTEGQTFIHNKVESRVKNEQRRQMERLQREKHDATNYSRFLLKKMNANAL